MTPRRGRLRSSAVLRGVRRAAEGSVWLPALLLPLGTQRRRTGRGRLASPPVCPGLPSARTKHSLKVPKVVIIAPRRHVGSRARPRDASGSVSRDLPTLAGPCWQSGCAGWRSPGFRGPGTSNSFPAGKLSGRGRGACPGAGSLPARASLPLAAVQTGLSSAALLPPPGARHLPTAPRRPLPLARPPRASTSRPPPPSSAEVPDIFTLQSPVAAVSFPSLPTERRASLVSGRHLTTHLSIEKFLAALPVDSNFGQCLGVPSSLTVSEVRIKSLLCTCLLTHRSRG